MSSIEVSLMASNDKVAANKERMIPKPQRPPPPPPPPPSSFQSHTSNEQSTQSSERMFFVIMYHLHSSFCFYLVEIPSSTETPIEILLDKNKQQPSLL